MSRTTSFCYLPGSEPLPADLLYLDSSIAIELVVELARLGIDCVTAREEGLAATTVDRQLTYATRARRMFVTSVLPLTLYWGKPHAGVLVVSNTVTSEDLVHHITTRLPMLPLPCKAHIESVPPLSEFIDSLHSRETPDPVDAKR